MNTLTLAEVLRAAMRAELVNLRVMLPGKVTAWNAAEQTVDVQPLVRRVGVEDDGTETPEELPVIPRVPVQFLRWGGFVFRCPLAIGDIVTLAVMDRDLEAWLSGDGSPATPRSARTHDPNDAIVIPGISTWGAPIENLDDGDLVLGREDGSGELRIKPDGTIILGNAGAMLHPVARQTDEVTIDAQSANAFITWLSTPPPPGGGRPPFTGEIKGRITGGASKVSIGE